MNEKHFKKFTDLKAALVDLHAKADSPEAHAVHDAAFAVAEDHKALFTDDQYRTLVAKSPEPS